MQSMKSMKLRGFLRMRIALAIIGPTAQNIGIGLSTSS